MNNADGEVGAETSGFRVRRVLLALIFGFAFTGYVQRTSVAAAGLWLWIDTGRPAPVTAGDGGVR